MGALFSNITNITWQQVVMWIIGGVLIYLAIKKDMEPTLLLPMGFGAILVNLPLSGAVTQIYDGIKEIGVIDVLFESGITNELFPLLLFIGIGAMIDFEPLLSNPKLMIFGAAAQFGIPDVCKSSSQDGTEGGPAEFPSYAFDRRKRIGADCLRHSRRTSADIARLRW